jgi:hypothetical protein
MVCRRALCEEGRLVEAIGFLTSKPPAKLRPSVVKFIMEHVVRNRDVDGAKKILAIPGELCDARSCLH